jgi:hypothetical protein
MTEHSIDIKDYSGKRTVFSEAQRVQKSRKHPELREEHFIMRMKEAIQNPDFIYEDLDTKTRKVHYRREYSINTRIKYTKVVIQEARTYNIVITAYRPDYVKERGKTKLLYGKDTN